MASTDNQDDSDIQYMSEVNRLEESYMRKKSVANSSVIDDSITSIPSSQKKRKEKEDEEKIEEAGLEAEITCFQASKRSLSNVKIEKEAAVDEDDDIIVDLVKPVSSKQPQPQLVNNNSRTLLKTNSFSGSTSSSLLFNQKSSQKSSSNLDESVQIIPLNHPRGYAYQYDGLGGRKKIFKAESDSNTATGSKSTTNRFFKFKS